MNACERDAGELLSFLTAGANKRRLFRYIPDFFLGKVPPDVSTIEDLKKLIATEGEIRPDAYELIRREQDFSLAMIDCVLAKKSLPVLNADWSVGEQLMDARMRFYIRGVRKRFLKDALGILPDLEARIPLDQLSEKCNIRRQSFYRTFRRVTDVYSFSVFEFGDFPLLLELPSTVHRMLFVRLHAVNQARLTIACYEYRQRYGVFRNT